MKNKTISPALSSQQRKTFGSALNVFLEKEIPGLKGELIRKPIVEAICQLIDRYFPSTERMRVGQMIWIAVDEKEKAGYGKKIENSQLKPVLLDLIHENDIEDVLQGMAKRVRQKKTAVRLFNQAYEQGGVLTEADVGSMMRLSAGTISKYVLEHEKEKQQIVPRRGNIHDMGRTLTHKRIICKKHYAEGKTIEQTARETCHSPAAVSRYIKDFKRVQECLKSNWGIEKISYTTGLSRSLTTEYSEMIKESYKTET